MLRLILLSALESKNAYKAAWEDKKRAISSLRAQIRPMISSLREYEDIDMLESVELAYEDISYRIRSYHTFDDMIALEKEHKLIIEALNNLYEDMYRVHLKTKISPYSIN